MTTHRPPAGTPLTPRELEILTIVATGVDYATIARRLWIAEGAVKTQMSRALRKLDARGRQDAVKIATRLGLIGGQP